MTLHEELQNIDPQDLEKTFFGMWNKMFGPEHIMTDLAQLFMSYPALMHERDLIGIATDGTSPELRQGITMGANLALLALAEHAANKRLLGQVPGLPMDIGE